MPLPSWQRVGAGLLRIAALAAVIGPMAHAADNVQFDLIYPRNETYEESEVFPIAFAIHNYSFLPNADGFTMQWSIMPFSHGVIPGGISYDNGFVHVPKNASNPFIAVVNTNVSEWIHRKSRGQQYMLQLYPLYPRNITGLCSTRDGKLEFSLLMFSVESNSEAELRRGRNLTGTTIAPDPVQNAPDCPVPLFRIAVSHNESAECSDSVVTGNMPKNQTCTYSIDAEVKSSIASFASSSATSAFLATQPTSTRSTATNAATAMARSVPVGPALAAVGMVYCIIYQ